MGQIQCFPEFGGILASEEQESEMIIGWPSFKSRRHDALKGGSVYKIVRRPWFRIIWTDLQRTLIVGKLKVEFHRV